MVSTENIGRAARAHTFFEAVGRGAKAALHRQPVDESTQSDFSSLSTQVANSKRKRKSSDRADSAAVLLCVRLPL